MNKQFIIIDLENQRYCIPIDLVIGVIDSFNITNVPNSLSYVEGVSNIRGEVVPIVSLKKVFKINDSGLHEKKLLIVSISNHNIGLVVDGASNVVSVDASLVNKVPPIINSEGKTIFNMVATVDGELTMVIDPLSLFSETERKELIMMAEE